MRKFKKFKFIGDSSKYGDRFKQDENYYEGLIEHGWAGNIGWLASQYPQDWQEVFDDMYKVGLIDQQTVTFDQAVEQSSDDPVNPQHYKNGQVECIDAIKSAVVYKDGFAGCMVGKIIKYLWRYESKNGVQDIDKAIWYLNKLKEHEQSKRVN